MSIFADCADKDEDDGTSDEVEDKDDKVSGEVEEDLEGFIIKSKVNCCLKFCCSV